MTTMEQPISSRAADRSTAGAMVAVMTWPIVALLLTGATHFSVEAIWPDLKTFFVPPVIGPILLAYGVWAGFAVVNVTRSFGLAIVAGAILGVLPLMLQSIGFGVLLGRGVDVGLLAGIFGFTMVLFGSLLGGGFASARR
jgi:hypothetical protein